MLESYSLSVIQIHILATICIRFINFKGIINPVTFLRITCPSNFYRVCLFTTHGYTSDIAIVKVAIMYYFKQYTIEKPMFVVSKLPPIASQSTILAIQNEF